MSTDLKKIRFNIQLYIWYYVSLNLVLTLLKGTKTRSFILADLTGGLII